MALGVTFRPPLNKKTGKRPTNKSITYEEWVARNERRSGPLLNAFDKAYDKRIQDMMDVVESVGVSDQIPDEERALIDSLFSEDFDDLDGAGPSGIQGSSTNSPPTNQNTTEMGDAGNAAKRPRTEATTEAAAPMEGVSTATSKSGHNSASDGGFDSAQGPISMLPKGGYRSKHGQLMFKKIHRMKSWAIPYWNITTNIPARGGSNICTTPLIEIPWQYAYFYLSPEEFNLIPAGSHIESVGIKILHTVSQTSYPVGGTEATTAIANHPKVMIIGRDLEKTMRGGLTRQLTISDTLIPSNPQPVDQQEFIDKQYGTDQTALDAAVVIPGVITKIPYYNKNYFCMYQPDAATAVTEGFDNLNAPGYEYFSNHVVEINSNDVTWDYVDQMSYKFTSAPIGPQYRGLEIYGKDIEQVTGKAQLYQSRRNVTNATPSSDFTVAEAFGPSNYDSIPIVTYSSSRMEKGAHYVKGDSSNKPSRQPSYHIGMRAIDKNTPTGTTRASEFVLANIEFEVEATMVINLPSYPNRFVKPKYYNVGFENTPAGVNFYPNPVPIVTFGIDDSTATVPAVAAIDQVGNQATEGDMVVRRNPRRAIRTLPQVPAMVKKKDLEREEKRNKHKV